MVRRKKIIWQKEIVNYENFKSLRVLKFERYDFGGQKLPDGIGKLVHLRLFSLKFCILGELPSSIFNLPFLQTLDLRVLCGLKIPNVLGKTKRSRHLYLPTSPNTGEVREKLRLHGLGGLVILDGFDSSRHEIGDLQEFSNLRFLDASVADNKSLSIIIDHMSAIWQNLHENILRIRETVSISSEDGNVLLRKILSCGNLHSLIISAKIIRFPPYEEHFLQGIVLLTLASTEIHDDPMQTLEKLPQLRFLRLLSESYVGKELICHEFGFPQLR
ncbi:hypothetical protein ACH5RR_032050 [Cinchona calisaya]|uniref:Disease resistance R13L4/SHOC-2-like LRR domain-containing protein n=1 Tax=Cinchona calisaya TaxID=153742 RepID=A0ABD2YGZ8_9GENT